MNGNFQSFFQFSYTYLVTNAIEKILEDIVGWAHPFLMGLLGASACPVFVDCTFDCAPYPFKQLMILTIFYQKTGEYIPIFYVLLMSKTEQTYRYAFVCMI
jgi:hypothetical protein